MAGVPGLLGVANALDGMSRERAVRQAAMDRFNADGVEGLRERPKSGRPPWLDDGQLAASRRWCRAVPTPSATA